MSLCLAAAGLAVAIEASSFSLSWTHTIEKTEWQEDWRIEGDLLVMVEARIKGAGAGMEPPRGAVLKDGFYVFHLRHPAAAGARAPPRTAGRRLAALRRGALRAARRVARGRRRPRHAVRIA